MRSSTILSSADESDPVSLTNDLNSAILGINGVENFEVLALTQFLLPRIALISPLCARSLNGWAKCHLG